MKRRRIAAVTGSRADYGIFKPVLAAVHADPALELSLIVTGSHLSRRHGMTVSEINADRLPISARVPLGLQEDTPRSVGRALARAVDGLGAAFARLRPDLVLVLGDRYEILAAASAALPLRLPVAHIHGGDVTAGAWDESVRHAVTKLSHLHFPITAASARRLMQMGEAPWRVRAFGSPVADRIRSVPRMTRTELSLDLGLELRAPLGVVTFHPATLTADLGLAELDALLTALRRFPGTLVFTAPNADLGGAAVRARLERFLARRPRGRDALVDSLGQRRYFSLMALADLMAGNSSSGLLEAPHFRLPAVNVGSRQDGREHGPNVIDARPTAASVSRALARAMHPAFRRALPAAPGSRTPVAPRIARVLSEVPLDARLLRKEFHELR